MVQIFSCFRVAVKWYSRYVWWRLSRLALTACATRQMESFGRLSCKNIPRPCRSDGVSTRWHMTLTALPFFRFQLPLAPNNTHTHTHTRYESCRWNGGTFIFANWYECGKACCFRIHKFRFEEKKSSFAESHEFRIWQKTVDLATGFQIQIDHSRSINIFDRILRLESGRLDSCSTNSLAAHLN